MKTRRDSAVPLRRWAPIKAPRRDDAQLSRGCLTTALRLAAPVLSFVFLISCSSPVEQGTVKPVEQCPVKPVIENLGPVPPRAFTTDTTGYLAYRLPGSLPSYHFQIISRFENRTASTLYLGRCFPDSPQPLFSVVDAPPVESGYAQVWACIGSVQPFAIRTGEVRVDTLLVEGPNFFENGTNAPIGVTEGDFWLYYDVRLAAGDGAPTAPNSLKLSNAFRVRTTSCSAP